MQHSPQSDRVANLLDLPFRDIFFILLPCLTVESIIVRAMEGAVILAPTPVPAAAHPLSVKASGQRLYDLLAHRLLR